MNSDHNITHKMKMRRKKRDYQRGGGGGIDGKVTKGVGWVKG
jgi:hypothetical protein